MTKTEVVQSLVRPFVTLALVGTIIAGFFLGKIGAEAILGMAGMALQHWFNRREEQKASTQPVPTP